MVKRLLGIILLLVGLSGVAFSIGGVIVSRQLVDNVGMALAESLTLTSESLNTVHETLQVTKSTVSEVTPTSPLRWRLLICSRPQPQFGEFAPASHQIVCLPPLECDPYSCQYRISCAIPLPPGRLIQIKLTEWFLAVLH